MAPFLMHITGYHKGRTQRQLLITISSTGQSQGFILPQEEGIAIGILKEVEGFLILVFARKEQNEKVKQGHIHLEGLGSKSRMTGVCAGGAPSFSHHLSLDDPAWEHLEPGRTI